VIIRIQSVGDVTIFHCAGRMTFGSEDTVRSAVSKLSAGELAVLDLAEVTATDAAGLGALVSLRKWIKTKGVTLKLMNVTQRVEKLLELSNLRSVLSFVLSQRCFVCCAGHSSGLSLETWKRRRKVLVT
jgi:anti-anti-sigma factor